MTKQKIRKLPLQIIELTASDLKVTEAQLKNIFKLSNANNQTLGKMHRNNFT